MQVSPVSPTSLPSAAANAPATVSSPQALGVNDFMKLLATQFQQQDPLKPMDDTAFIAQTAQFTALQQTTTLTQQVTQLAAAQGLATATSYIGRQLTVDTGKGQTDTGTVSAVDTSGSAPQVIINGISYPLSSILQVAPAAAPVPGGS
jgi:flagellar basal-body rod modification protein FlgD